ncbi:hypothetical protein SAMN04488115_105125 [Bosea lathyri]|uniref:Uncharacterized protein n=1 Tax=Bosea lathyri TaxID=1036778 RepID=A0A1H5ZZQ9_9HYPH|nr:hypothetical protein SAMN04488115_105125 [Bosea lathyri]
MGGVTVVAVSLLTPLWQRLANWFAQAAPAEPGSVDAYADGDLDDREVDEARRKSIQDVTLEQLGIAHWSCHTHF